MKINTITKILVVFLLTNLMVSCVKDTDYELPDMTIPIPEFNGEVKNIADVIATTTEEVTEYQDNDALEGYVISSDEGGNFYKKIYIENTDKTHGFAIALDKAGLYAEYPLGAKVQIRLKGLSVQLVDGHLEIGYKTYTSKSGRVSVGTIPPAVYKEHFYNLQEELMPKEELAKSSTSVSDLKRKDNVNLLLTFENVYFDRAAVGKTFHVKENDNYAGTNYNLIDSEGNKIAFRTSKYAKFKDENVPEGLLNVTGILTTYNGSYQFLVSNSDDIEVVGEAPSGGSNGGDDTTVLALPVEETFDEGLPKSWRNIATKGKKVWQKRDYSGVNYVQISAYSSGNILDVEAWLITPKINLGDTENNILKVKLADAYQNGNPLRVVYSSDYDGGADPKSATWTKIGTEAIAALINNSSRYDNKYEESQPIKIPTTGEIYIAFVYESKGEVSTTVQLESVSVTKGDAGGDDTTPGDDDTTAEVKNISDIRAMYTGEKMTIGEEMTIKGIVISDRTTGNTNGKNLVIQDESAGITLRFKVDHDINLGQQIEVSIKDAELSEYKGLLQLNNLETTAVSNVEEGTLPEAKTVSIEDILAGKYQSEWVKIESVQFKDTNNTYSGSNIITNCTDELPVFVNSNANFSSEELNSKRGTITGYVARYNDPQLIINNTTNVDFNQEYKDCSSGTTPPSSGGSDEGSLIISEYVEGSSNNKYIEIYNTGNEEVDLSLYKMNLYTNGNQEAKNSATLSEFQATLGAGKILIVKNAKANLEFSGEASVYESTLTYFNGNDAIALIKDEKIIDVIGVIGEDPGKAWEVAGVANATLDHTLVRKSSVTKGTSDWAASAGTDANNSQWIVKDKDDASSLGKR